ncbi:MAG: hypothetical protein LBD94_03290 [Rickettsiales bacterium]|nr:hypothetical protein [Rickettsiales bacterium]
MKNIRTIRNTLFKAWLINMIFIFIFWGYVEFDLMRYAIWGMPGFTVEAASSFMIILAGVIEIAGLVLFLVPALALSWQIQSEKKMAKSDGLESIKLKGQIPGNPISSSPNNTKKKSKPKSAKRKTKR